MFSAAAYLSSRQKISAALCGGMPAAHQPPRLLKVNAGNAQNRAGGSRGAAGGIEGDGDVGKLGGGGRALVAKVAPHPGITHSTAPRRPRLQTPLRWASAGSS